MLHLWWFYFCYVLQIVVQTGGEYWVFSLFSKSQQLFYQSYKSVRQSKKMIQQCIFLTGIYLLVICTLFVFVFYGSF